MMKDKVVKATGGGALKYQELISSQLGCKLDAEGYIIATHYLKKLTIFFSASFDALHLFGHTFLWLKET